MGQAQARILLVEDEEDIVAGLRYALEAAGYTPTIARDGQQALDLLRTTDPDLVLLDVMLPHVSGFDVLRSLREQGRSVPVILLTAKDREMDKVRGLDLGADDYVTKPFALSELMARIRARLRTQVQTQDDVPNTIEFDNVRIDFRAFTLTRGKNTFDLTVREADILKLLYCHRGEAVTRNQLLREVWGDDAYPSTRTVDQHMAKLRKKVEADPKNPRYIVTVHGVGYRLLRLL